MEVLCNGAFFEVECSYIFKDKEGHIVCSKDRKNTPSKCAPMMFTLTDKDNVVFCKSARRVTLLKSCESWGDWFDAEKAQEDKRQLLHPKCPKCNGDLFNGPRMSEYYYCEGCSIAYPIWEFDSGNKKCGQKVGPGRFDCEHLVKNTCPNKKGCPYDSIATRWKKCKDWPMH